MRKWVFVAGVAVGYVLGARAGRERYEQIATATRKVREHQMVRDTAEMASYQVGKVAGTCRQRFMESSMGTRLFGEQPEPGITPPAPDYWESAGIATSSRGRPDRTSSRDF